MRRKPAPDESKFAESLAIDVLVFLGDKPEALERFLSLAGVGPDTLRLAAREPGFLAAVLSFVADDHTLLTDFSAHSRHPPETIAKARTRLAGPDWERDTA